ncbi:hypothetical protein OS493_005154 [Desmophyllum pertusum]|uniref:Uncharacterized protein n=1 Tax=Desmophyllum pertusum TaxID=174260 RepID=A0A9X0CVE5_9CNID|nr:hypothetical protein OS493_005154 [Desmophyllum pertusum]
MAATAGRDAAWLQTGWEQNQGHSSQMRHYRAPAPCQKGASKNSLLQCNKMSVKTKQVDEKARQIRFKYGKNNLERELNKKKGIDMTPFVTKVQIRKTQEKNRLKSAGRASTRRRIESEMVHYTTIQNSEEKRTVIDTTLKGDWDDKEALSSLKTVDEKDETEEEAMLCEDIIAVRVNEKKLDDNYSNLYPGKQLENVQHLIKCLTRRLRDPFEASRKQVPPTRPIAAYARPTKGEIALSIKGPVLLAPVSKVAMTTAQGQSPDWPNRLDVRSLPEFVGSRTERARTRPISSVSDSVVVTGKKIHGAGRATWVGCEHAQNGSFGQRYRLCCSCKDQYGSGSDTKQRAKSAVFRDVTRQRKSDGCLPQLFRQTPTKLHSRDAGNHSASPRRGHRSRNGMVSPFELQVHLDELNSHDYGSPVPPPSPSNSTDEEATV